MKIALAALLWLSISVLVANVVGTAIRFGIAGLPGTTGSKRAASRQSNDPRSSEPLTKSL